MDESLEGTRVRLDPVTVVTAPDASGMWTVSDATGTATIFGVDEDDPSENEDADGPTPGDVYRVYGALRQIGEDYIIDLSDIDTLSLVVGVADEVQPEWSVSPNPAAGWTRVSGIAGPCDWVLFDTMGRPVRAGRAMDSFILPLDGLATGRYALTVDGGQGPQRKSLVVR